MSWTRIADVTAVTIAFAALIAVAFALVLAALSASSDDPPRSNRTSWTDDHGRLCTQVDPPGEAIALDCDFPTPTTGG